MKRTRLLLITLFSFLIASSALAQGTSILSYRMGAPAGHVDAVGLSEYKVRLPGLQLQFNKFMAVRAAVGYHHANFGSNMRFWNAQPMDSFIMEGSLVMGGTKASISLGSSLRFPASTEI